jgi:hypothetical protein
MLDPSSLSLSQSLKVNERDIIEGTGEQAVW